MSDIVGIVGCNGDLGGQLALLHRQFGVEVVGFDIEYRERPFKVVQSLAELQVQVENIHWCAPASVIDTYDAEHTDLGRVILHDSVMNNSALACDVLSERTNRGVGMAHMLMNSQNMVVIAQESDDPISLVGIFEDIGCKTQIMSAVEHDTVMAHSQAIYAILHELVSEELTTYGNFGLLTPSGEELKGALESRAAIWTPATMASLLKNPQIIPLLEKARNMAKARNGN